MVISETIIRAFADAYTLQQLQEMRAAALQDLVENPNLVTSVNTGGGASYSQQARMTAAERIELLQRAIDYKQGNAQQEDLAQFGTPVIWLRLR